MTDSEDLRAAQQERWQELDPLLPAPVALPEVTLRAPGAAGAVSPVELAPGDMRATWTALRVHHLAAHVAGPDPAAAMAALLDAWDAQGPPGGDDGDGGDGDGDDDTARWLDWPSRDTSAVLPLVRHGFAPAVVIAVRRTGGAGVTQVPGVAVRPLERADVPAAAALGLELVRFDARLGTVTERPWTLAGLTEGLSRRVDRRDPHGWVAEQDGQVVGLCTVEPPEDAGWIGSRCAGGPTGYLESMIVTASARSAGIGAALAATADTALVAAGARTTVLHHSPANPLSTPFWYRQGYRPLWTGWARRPAGPTRR